MPIININLANNTALEEEPQESRETVSKALLALEAEAPVVEMELEEHNPRFMARYARYEPKIKDSHAIRILKTCPRKYFYEIVLGRVSSEKAIVFVWGLAYHKFREFLSKNYGFGDTEPARYDDEKAKMAYVTAAQKGLQYWLKHGSDQPPDSKFAYMTLLRLQKSFEVAFAHWKKERLLGRIKVIAVEQAFNFQLPDGTYSSGRADEIVLWNDLPWGRDFKTTSKDTAFYARQLAPNDQFTRYTVGETAITGQQVRGQIIELLFNAKPTKKETKGPEVFELTASRTPSELDTFVKEQVVINRTLQIYRETDVWPMHETACAFCPFHSVCVKPTEESQMAQLEQHFIVRAWDNTKVGVDED